MLVHNLYSLQGRVGIGHFMNLLSCLDSIKSRDAFFSCCDKVQTHKNLKSTVFSNSNNLENRNIFLKLETCSILPSSGDEWDSIGG